MHDSEARLHFLWLKELREGIEKPRRPIGFDPPTKPVTELDLYKQPYGLPSHFIEEGG